MYRVIQLTNLLQLFARSIINKNFFSDFGAKDLNQQLYNRLSSDKL